MTDVVVGSLKYDDRPVSTEHPLFEAIWQAIKGWDVSRHNDGLYSGASGTDVQIIIDSIEAYQPQPVVQGEAVAWFPTLKDGSILRHFSDGTPVPANITKEGAEQSRLFHLGTSGNPVVPLYATPTIPTGHRVVPVDAEFVVPDGWVFYSADFSCVVSGRTLKGQIMLKRDPDGKNWWHSLTEKQQEDTDLYVRGNGVTVQSAIDDAASKIAASPSVGGV
jgi:hypothetical protein